MTPPVWLLRGLPYAAVALVVLGGVAWIDHRGYQRAREDLALDRAKARIELQNDLRASEGRMGEKFATIDRNLASRIDGLDNLHRTIIQPTIEREIASDPRYSSPACSISDGVRAALNAARSGGTCTATAGGGIRCALPGAAASGGQ